MSIQHCRVWQCHAVHVVSRPTDTLYRKPKVQSLSVRGEGGRGYDRPGATGWPHTHIPLPQWYR